MDEQRYMQLKELDDELKHVNNHVENIDEQIQELKGAQKTVNEFMELKAGDKLKVPLAHGVYIDASVDSTDTVMVNVGAGVAVDKSPDDVLKILDDQLAEMQEYREQLMARMKALIQKMEKLQSSNS